MNKSRSELREKCMIILYQEEMFKKSKYESNLEDLITENLDIDNEFVKEIVYGVITHNNEITELANLYLKDWDLNRIDKTGAAILKMAIYELKFTDTPQVVVINEAIELAKKYSDDNVRKIINAVLDRIIKE
ncbi:MAG TPA: transcription antitermination factor NusB [Bacilli bacterium]|nr:transcription antitermination factor NusB [Bacilli bacterium]